LSQGTQFVAAAPSIDSHSHGKSNLPLRVNLLDGFELRCCDRRLELPLSTQRVVAFLALHDKPLHRIHVAGILWIETSEERANASLRTALWRLRRVGTELVEATTSHIWLGGSVEVDVREAGNCVRRVLERAEISRAQLSPLCGAGELLPDWYDDWVLIERERFRQLRLHALEALCAGLAEAGDYPGSTEAGLAAVAAEPLRESAHRLLIKAHLAEGNLGEALRQYELYRRLLADQLGLEPSPKMSELIEAVAIV
jgi:DNA-binding SARP family transcriptional activator